MTRIGVALSGGGHRASVFGAGLLLYLADAGRQGDVGGIASVSGGSITNGVVAHEMDYRQASTADVRAGLRPLLRHIAYTGLFFWARARTFTPDAFARANGWPDRAARAREAIAWLGDTPGNRARWAEVAEKSRNMPTVLRKLGPGDNARLLWHAYVLAACNLHVLLPDFGLPELPAEDQFRGLIWPP